MSENIPHKISTGGLVVKGVKPSPCVDIIIEPRRGTGKVTPRDVSGFLESMKKKYKIEDDNKKITGTLENLKKRFNVSDEENTCKLLSKMKI